MIPLRDNNPTSRIPYVTYTLIAVNIIIYLVDRVGAQGAMGNLWNLSMVPQAVIKNKAVSIPVGMGYGRVIYETYRGLSPQWLTIFTSMFMHGSIMHIAGNMLYLWIFGNNIEDTLGHFTFIIFYLASGFFAAIAHILSNVNSTIPLVGASGAIAGVLGAYLLLFPRARVTTLVLLLFFWSVVEVPAMIVLGLWFIGQLFNVLGSSGSVSGGVAYGAHIGGFIAGIVLILIMGKRRLLRKRAQSNYWDYYS